jgi:hypothetical protein
MEAGVRIDSAAVGIRRLYAMLHTALPVQYMH